MNIGIIGQGILGNAFYKNISPKIFNATNEKNKEVRFNRDWENTKGRAEV